MTDETSKKTDDINCSPSKRTLIRCMNEVKVTSVLDGGFSVTKLGIQKDHHRHTSENSLRNALNYAVAVVCIHFIVGEQLEEKYYDVLSDEAKRTIELVKKLSNNEKVRPLYPDQIFGSDDARLLMHLGDTQPSFVAL